MKSARFVNLIFAFVFLAVAVFASVFLYRDYQHYDNLRTQQALLEKRLESLDAEHAEREDQLQKLKGDTEYIESVIRAKLKYAKEDETIFRFEK